MKISKTLNCILLLLGLVLTCSNCYAQSDNLESYYEYRIKEGKEALVISGGRYQNGK